DKPILKDGQKARENPGQISKHCPSKWIYSKSRLLSSGDQHIPTITHKKEGTMKRKRLTVMDVREEDILSRNEMKHIMAGSGGTGSCNPPCRSDVISCCCGDGRVNCVDTPQECISYCGL